MFIKPCHFSFSWARRIKLTPSHPVSSIYIYILSSHLCLCLPNDVFLSFFLTRILKACLLSPAPRIRHTPRPLHLPSFAQPNNVGLAVQIMKFLIMQFSQCPVTSSSLGQSTFFSTTCLNTLSLRSSLNVRDEVLRLSKTTGRFSVLYSLPFTLLYSKETCKKFDKMNVCTTWIRRSSEVLWFLFALMFHLKC